VYRSYLKLPLSLSRCLNCGALVTHGDNLASAAAITRLLCAQKRRVCLIGANDLHPPVAFIIQRCLIYRPRPSIYFISPANNGLAPGSRYFALEQPQRLDTLMPAAISKPRAPTLDFQRLFSRRIRASVQDGLNVAPSISQLLSRGCVYLAKCSQRFGIVLRAR
jgi:hypothetical protein